MAIPVPKYLEEIAEIEKMNSSFIVLNIKCPCGCSQFNLYRNVKNSKQDKEWQEWEQRLSKWGKIENYTDPVDGKRYLVKRNLFGKIIERISVEDIPKQSDRNIISATCCSCGNKYVLFDNSMHGYNAFAEQSVGNELIEFAEIVKKQAQSGRFIVKIKIFNDSSLDAFAENTGEEISLEQYSEAFSDITIYGYSEESGNKRILIHSEETA